jgi:DNA-binding beta-propeller fold protein YncE
MILIARSAYAYLASICHCVASSLRLTPALILVLGIVFCSVASAQTAHFSGAQIALGGGFSQPSGVAVDTSGNVYVVDSSNNAVKEIPAGCLTSTCVVPLGGSYGFSGPKGIGVDASGNVFVADSGANMVEELTPNCTNSSCVTVLGGGYSFNNPTAVNVDAAGDVFVAVYGAHTVAEIPAGCSTSGCVKTIGSGFISPDAVAIDSRGNVFVTDSGTNYVSKISTVSTPYDTTTRLATGFTFYSLCGIALDSSGNLYVADSTLNAVEELYASGYSTVVTLASNYSAPRGVAVDPSGNVYLGDYGNNAVEKVMTSNVNIGSMNVGSTSSAVQLIFTFDTGGTIKAPAVLTQGAANLDFKDSGDGTCTSQGTSHSNSAGDTCTVDVTFTPKYPGSRYGAVLLEDGAGNVLATAYIYGTGTGPMVNFLPGTVTTLAVTNGHFSAPYYVAVDGSGNVFVADQNLNAVKEILAVGGYTTVNTLAVANGHFSDPHGIAVDGAGNVFVADESNNAVKEILAAGGYTTVNTLAVANGNFFVPAGVAVDGSGNVFVADYGHNAVKEILAAGGYTTVTTLANGNFSAPYDVAVDGSGNVFVADYGHKAVKEIVAAGGYTTVNTLAVANGNFSGPTGVAVDGSGNVFVADGNNHAVKKIVAEGGYTTVNTWSSGLASPYGVAVDGSGNIFVGDPGVIAVKEIDLADAPRLNYDSTVVGSTSGAQSVTVENIGNAALTFSAVSYPTDFPEAYGVETDCISSTSLTAGESCTLSVEFAPLTAGGHSEMLTLTDNALNVSAATQSVALSGAATTVTITLSPSSETLTAGTVGTAYSQTFTASGGISPHTYAMTITSGSLPSGLTFSGGVLSGTPSASGSVSFTIIASDSSASPGPYSSSSQSYSLTVNAPLVDSTSTAVSVTPMFITGQAASITATVTDTTHSGTTPTGGTVAFTDAVNGGSAIALSGSPVTLSSGQANLSVVLSGAGTHVITATYAGVGGTFASSSGTSTVGPSSNVGTATSSYPVTLTFTAGGTLNSINVLTQGAPNLDFSDAVSGDTCVVNLIYSIGGTCKVNVTFTPKYPGPRYGAVLLEDGSGTVIATAYLTGMGTGPMVSFPPGIVSTLAVTNGNFSAPYYVAVDGSGNVFVADQNHNAVKEILAAGGYTTVNTLAVANGNFSIPHGIAVDGAGNVFVADEANNAVKEILAAGGYTTVNTLAVANGNFYTPSGVAVDGSGNVFVADYSHNAVKEILAAGGYTTVNTLAVANGNFLTPYDVAVDGSGNVFVADYGHNAVKEILAAGGYTTVNTLAVANGNFSGPTGVAVDGSGNVFVADLNNHAVKEILAEGGYTTVNTWSSGLASPYGVAVDGSGNVFVGDPGVSAVKKIDFADPPSLSYASTVVGSTSSAQSVTVANVGNAALTFSASGLTAPTDFTLVAGSGTPADCAANGSVAAGASCNLSIEFKPTQVGSPLNESFVLTDNALNVSSATQSVALSGVATAPTITLSPSSETLTAGTAGIAYSQTFTASGGISPHTYAMTITSGSLPSGLTFSGGVLSGTPSAAGSVSFTIVASDSSTSPGPYSSSSQSYSLTINASPVTITLSPSSETLTAGTVGTAYSQTFTASGGISPHTYAMTITSGSLPSGLTFSGGVLSGTPSATGSVSFTIVASDSSASPGPYSSSSQSYSLTINASSVDSTSTTVSVTPTFISGQTASITATVTDTTQSGTTPTGGTVAFTDAVNGVVAVALSGSPVTLSSGQANLSVALSGAGTHVITATYTGVGGTFASSSGSGTSTVGLSSNVGTATSSYPVTLTFTAGGTLNSINVLTQGAPNLDFRDAVSGDTCAVSSIYGTGNSCTVYVTFTPKYPGPRYGAVVLEDGVGNVLATAFIYGTGTGPMVSFPPGIVSMLAVANGNFSSPFSVAVDGSGNVFVADFNNNVVKEILAAGGYTTVNTLAVANGNFNGPTGVAVDGSGNVFVTDCNNNAVKEILAAGGYTTVNTLAVANGNFNSPYGVAVDGSGNVFVADYGNNAVKEILAVGGYTTVNTLAVANGNFNGPSDVAVDGSGNIFVADGNNNAVKEILAAGGYTTVNTLAVANGNFNDPSGVAVDGSGNVLVADYGNNAVKEIDFADPPSLAFLTPTPTGSTDSTDGSLVVTVENIGNAPLTISQISTAANFSLSGNGTPCSTSGQILAPSASCALGIDFNPTMAGSISGSVILTDNALNVTNATQLIALQGIGTQSSQSILFPKPGPLTYGVGPVTLDAAASSALPVSYTVTSGPATVSGSTLTIAGAGSVTVQATQAGNANYTAAAPVSVTFAVGQASLTVTANNASKMYGAANPGFTPSYSGFANGDTAAVLTGSPSLTTTATATSAVGNYPITSSAGTLTEGNYSFTFVSGTLAVNQATASVTPIAASKSYGSSDPAFSGTLTGFLAGDGVTATYSRAAGETVAGGPYAISSTLTPVGVLGNYNITYNAAAFTINKAALVATAINVSVPYAAAIPALSGTLTGVVSSDGITASFMTAASSSSPAGSYAITPVLNDPNSKLANYNAVLTSGTLTIGQEATTASVQTSAPSVALQSSVTLTVKVASITATPVGSVTFMDGSTQLGTATLDNTGTAMLSISTLSVGSHTITAVYAGNADFTGSTSNAITEKVQDFTITGGPGSSTTPPAETALPGGTATYAVQFVPTVGSTFPSAVTFTLSGLPVGATYTITPSTIPAGSGVTNVSVVVNVGKQQTTLALAAAPPPRGFPKALAFAMFLPLLGTRKLRRALRVQMKTSALMLMMLGVLMVSGMTACGNGSGFFTQAPQTYPLTLTGTSGALHHSVTLNLTIQ